MKDLKIAKMLATDNESAYVNVGGYPMIAYFGPNLEFGAAPKIF